jgi:hypothetical protein
MNTISCFARVGGIELLLGYEGCRLIAAAVFGFVEGSWLEQQMMMGWWWLECEWERWETAEDMHCGCGCGCGCGRGGGDGVDGGRFDVKKMPMWRVKMMLMMTCTAGMDGVWVSSHGQLKPSGVLLQSG